MRDQFVKLLSPARLLIVLAFLLLTGCAPTGASANLPTTVPVAAATFPPTPTATAAATDTPTAKPASPAVKLTAGDAGKLINLQIGQTLGITLAGNPSTGYTWEMEPVEQPILSQVGEPVIQPSSNLIGAPALLSFTFKADANGTQLLRLIYHRPWEKDVPPVNSFDVTVVVGQIPTQPIRPTYTADTRPTPVTVVFPAAGMQGWLTYTNASYGFSLQYPPEWRLEPGYGTMTGHAVLLTPNNANALLVAAFKRTDEDAQIGRTGLGGGDLELRGKVMFLGKEIDRQVLVSDGKDMTVLYCCTNCMVRGDLQFDFGLDYRGNWSDPTALPADIERQADLVVASVKLNR